MKTTDLAPILQKPITSKTKFGIARLEEKGWENIPFVVPPPPPKRLERSLPFKLIAEAQRALSALPTPSEMTELDKLVSYLFIRREVVQSSRLEGTWSTIDHALTPGDLSDSGEGKSEHIAVRSYAKVMEEVIAQAMTKKEEIFSIKLISKIQREIVESDPNSNGVPGRLRTPGSPGSIVTIGGMNRKENSTYNPAPPGEVKRCLSEVIEWLKDEDLALQGDAGSGLSLPVRLAVGHAHFEAVHPFTDGNGRTGRALWAIQMICAGSMPLHLSGYVEARKEDYIRGLEQAQKKLNYAPLIEFICNAIIESSLELKRTQEVIVSLVEVWKQRGKFRKKSAAERALPLLLHYPILTSAILQKELEISGPASTNAINLLVERKIIRHRQFENRRPIYAAEELIQILARPFGSDIDLSLEKGRMLMGFST
jgi:Fic family protein